MIHQFDHRWATYDGSDGRDATTAEKRNADFEATPRYWVPEAEVADRLSAKGWTRGWLMGWRDITNATNERTVIAAALPRLGVGHTLRLLSVDQPAELAAALLAGSGDSQFDFVARQKVGGTHLTVEMWKQLPVLPQQLLELALSHLSYHASSNSHAPALARRHLARNLGYDGPPLAWDENRRMILGAELDAWYARAYGLTRNELRYILDPADVMGPDYPSETFRVLKDKEKAPSDGEYRTARLVLAAWDAQETQLAAAQ